MKQFENVISLGAFCHVAMELRRLGIREAAYPFDWIITDMKSCLQLIDNHFLNFVTRDLLEKQKNNKIDHVYDNKDYSKVEFIHDFDKNMDNYQEMAEKYNRRIERFYNDITAPTLFLRYIMNRKDYKYILRNYAHIKQTLRKYNQQNDIIFIINDNVKIKHITNWIKGIKIYPVKKDDDYTIAQQFLKKLPKLQKKIFAEFKNA